MVLNSLIESTLRMGGSDIAKTYPFAWFVILSLANETFLNPYDGLPRHYFDPAGSHGLTLAVSKSDERNLDAFDIRFGAGNKTYADYLKALQVQYLNLKFHADPALMVFKEKSTLTRENLNSSYSASSLAQLELERLQIPTIGENEKLKVGIQKPEGATAFDWGFEIFKRRVITGCTELDFAQSTPDYYGYLGTLQLNFFADADGMKGEKPGADWNDVTESGDLGHNAIVTYASRIVRFLRSPQVLGAGIQKNQWTSLVRHAWVRLTMIIRLVEVRILRAIMRVI